MGMPLPETDTLNLTRIKYIIITCILGRVVSRNVQGCCWFSNLATRILTTPKACLYPAAVQPGPHVERR